MKTRKKRKNNDGKLKADSEINFKFNEQNILQDVLDYFAQTYQSHYAKKDGLQAIDVMISMDPKGAHFHCKCTALKYIMRYGEKGGLNRKDIYKIIHYLLFMMHIEDNNDFETTDSIDGDVIEKQ